MAGAAVSSMTAVSHAPQGPSADHADAPWSTHWSRTCTHDFVVRLRRYESGTVCARRQCRKCGRGSGQPVSKVGVTEWWDTALEERVSADFDAAVEEYRNRLNQSRQRLFGLQSEQWWRAYNEYLNGPVWQAKRRLVFRRANGTCEACGERAASEVHHLVYPKTFGLEPLWDLRAVCRPCHRIIHPHMA